MRIPQDYCLPKSVILQTRMSILQSMSSSNNANQTSRSSIGVERGSIASILGPQAKPSSRGPDDLAHSMKRWLEQQPHEEPYCGLSLSRTPGSGHGELLAKLVVLFFHSGIKAKVYFCSAASGSRKDRLTEKWSSQFSDWELVRTICREGCTDISQASVSSPLYLFPYSDLVNLRVAQSHVANVQILDIEKC